MVAFAGLGDFVSVNVFTTNICQAPASELFGCRFPSPSVLPLFQAQIPPPPLLKLTWAAFACREPFVCYLSVDPELMFFFFPSQKHVVQRQHSADKLTGENSII